MQAQEKRFARQNATDEERKLKIKIQFLSPIPYYLSVFIYFILHFLGLFLASTARSFAVRPNATRGQSIGVLGQERDGDTRRSRHKATKSHGRCATDSRGRRARRKKPLRSRRFPQFYRLQFAHATRRGIGIGSITDHFRIMAVRRFSF